MKAVLVALLALLIWTAPAAAQQPPPWLDVRDGVTPAAVRHRAGDPGDGVRRDAARHGPRRRARPRADHDLPPARGAGPRLRRAGRVRAQPVPRRLRRGRQPPGRRRVPAAGARARRGRRRSGAAPARRARGRSTTRWPSTTSRAATPSCSGESIGTFGSDGCPDVGGRAETLGTKAVIDWLNGRARGFDAGGRADRGGWTTGDVGMVGTSYNGTLPNQVATTGVEGLKTIIPVSAISSWYDYYRANGLVVAPHSNERRRGRQRLPRRGHRRARRLHRRAADGRGVQLHAPATCSRAQDRVTGDYSPFWAAARLPRPGRPDPRERVRRPRAQRLQRQDEGVRRVVVPARPRAASRASCGCTTAATAGRSGEGAAAYQVAEHRWFDRYLFGVRNGIDREPRATVQREDDSYVQEADWPAPGTRTAKLALAARSATAPGDLSRRARGRSREQSFVDRGRELDTDDVLIQGPDAASPNRLVYRTAPLAARRAPQRHAVGEAAAVDRQPHGGERHRGARRLRRRSGRAMVTRGWIDPQNRHGAARSRADRPGPRVRPAVRPPARRPRVPRRAPDRARRRVSTDHDYTIRPKPGTRLTLDPGGSALSLPVVGGAGALR